MSGSRPYAAVVERFVDGLAERRRCMAEAARDLDGAQGEQAAAVLRQEAHRIAGTAGSLGFPALGAAALDLEQSVESGASVADIRHAHHKVSAAAEGLQAAESTLLAPDGGIRNPDAWSDTARPMK